MKWGLALLGLALACSGATPVVQAPSPTMSPKPTATATATATPTFNPRSFSVGLYYTDSEAVAAQALGAELPAAWVLATGGRSELHRTSAIPDIYIFLGKEPPAVLAEGIQRAYFIRAPGLRFVYLYRGTPEPTLEVVHELGHLLGAPHWTDCPNPPVEIMCFYQGSATVFSERELRAMGLSGGQ